MRRRSVDRRAKNSPFKALCGERGRSSMNVVRRKHLGLVPLCAILFVLANLTDVSLTHTGVREGYLAVTTASGAPSAVAVAHAAGEFRIAAANIIWLNVVDHYHHQYMAHGGDWSRNKSVLPLINMIVILDPHFVQAYDVGSLILCQLNRYAEAQEFLKQGIANNPTDWSLPYDEAMLYAWYRRDAAAALPYALKADGLATDPFDKHRLDMLCDTLKSDIQKHVPTRPAGV
jgi:hypothetical protein